MEFPLVKPISECYIKPKYEVHESKQPYYLSPFDLVFLSCHYNQKGLLFAKPNNPQDFDIHKFLETLKDALAHTLVYFYPLAGQLDKIIDEERHKMLVFTDCNKGLGARFVHAKLDIKMSDITTPIHVPEVVKSFFDHENGDKVVNYDGISRPLLSIQVTELIDGVFIGCTMNHLPADGTSYWHFWNIWSEIHCAMNNGDENISISRQPIHKRWVPHGYEPPQLQERFVHFSPETIAKLKFRANQEINNNNKKKKIIISSFQALTAFIWKSIIRAKGLEPDQTTQCHLVANNRTRLSPPLAEEYFGNALGVLSSTTTVSELLDQNIGKTALLLNQSVVNHTNKVVQDYAVSWFKSPFVYKFDQLLGVETKSTVQIGSSPRFDVYGNEFAGVGKPIAVRSGFANKFDGKVILYPGLEGGGSVDIEMCFSCDNIRALECDQEFMAAVV